MIGLDLAREVSTPSEYRWTRDELSARAAGGYAAGREHSPATAALLEGWTGPRRAVAAFDFGIKRNILDLLVACGFDVTVVPADTRAERIISGGFDGVFLSNGPGDPAPVTYGIETVRNLVGRVPVFGICLGHQILGLALGADTFKLPFGHRGSNHPVARIGHDRIEITCQNHGFAVSPASIDDTPATLTHVNLNDQTVEGLAAPGLCYSVQYHPESGPGPHDSRYLFSSFHDLIDRFEPAELALGAPA
jgi:carbamoyl-phosphate synthase small subunit